MASKLKTPVTTAAEANAPLPKGWQRVRFGDVVRDVNEAERNPLDAGLEWFIGLEHIEPESLHLKQWGNLADGEISFTKRFRKGQVLFGKRRAYQRKVALADFDGICSSDILTFEPKGDALIPELLPFIVQSDGFFQHALGTSSGSLSPRTRWSQLQDFEFPLPPKDEQLRIAEILWAADEAEECWNNVVVSCGNAVSALVDDLFSGGNVLNPDFSTWTAPPDWKMLSLGEIVTFQGGSQPPRDTFEFTPRDGYVRLIQIRDYKSDEFSTYVRADLVRRFCSKTDVMIGRYGPPVFQILRGIEGAYNVALIKAIPGEGLLNDYLYYFLRQSTLFRLIDHLSQRSSGQTGVDMDALRGFPIPLPALEVQRQILKVVTQAEQAKRDADAHLKEQRDLKRRLLAPFNPSEK